MQYYYITMVENSVCIAETDKHDATRSATLNSWLDLTAYVPTDELRNTLKLTNW